MPYQVIKNYGDADGLSVAFRQWRADHSHCHFLHGYALQFSVTYECDELDDRNWVFDFGALKELKEWLKDNFDHKTLVAVNDPYLGWFERAHSNGILDLKVVPEISCEKFAEMVFQHADQLLRKSADHPRVRLVCVRAAEHAGNAAIYQP